MDWKTKYGIGDKVFINEKNGTSKPCNECNESGKVPYKDKLLECPECDGSGYYWSTHDLPLETTVIGLEISVWKDDINNTYYCTGYSGKIKEETVFMTEQDCLKAIANKVTK